LLQWTFTLPEWQGIFVRRDEAPLRFPTRQPFFEFSLCRYIPYFAPSPSFLDKRTITTQKQETFFLKISEYNPPEVTSAFFLFSENTNHSPNSDEEQKK